MTETITGGCRCGDVRYECVPIPDMSFHCHCRDCQSATGSVFATVAGTTKAGFDILKGDVKAYTVEAESGKEVTCEFYTNCGSPLFSYAEILPEVVFVKAGIMDDASWLKPGMACWTSSQQPWMAEAHGVTGFPENPDM